MTPALETPRLDSSFNQASLTNTEREAKRGILGKKTKGAFFYPQFWNKNGWYGMLGIIRIVCIKKPGRSWPSKHCVINMAADEEAAIAAVIAAIFLVLLVQ